MKAYKKGYKYEKGRAMPLYLIIDDKKKLENEAKVFFADVNCLIYLRIDLPIRI